MLIHRLQQGRPQELGRPEHKNIDSWGQWQGIDRGDGATHDHERVAAITVLPSSGDAGGVKGGEEVWLIEFERTAPCQHVEVAE